MSSQLPGPAAGSDREALTIPRITRQWFCVLGPLAAAYLQEQLAFAFTGWACSRRIGLLVHLPSILALLVIAAALHSCRLEWERGGRQLPRDEPGALGPIRFFAAAGFAIAVMAGLLVLAQWLPTLFVHPCQR